MPQRMNTYKCDLLLVARRVYFSGRKFFRMCGFTGRRHVLLHPVMKRNPGSDNCKCRNDQDGVEHQHS